MNILLVEDEQDILEIVSIYLKNGGHTIITAQNGEDGWSIFSQTPDHFDLIISDLKMPICGGLELLQRIRQHLYEIPVVIVSGEGTLQHSIDAFKLGIFDFLIKPISFDVLTDILARVEKRIEEKLSESKWQSLIKNTSDYIISLDSHYNITFINRHDPSFSKKQCIGKNVFTQILPFKNKDWIKKRLDKVFTTKEYDHFEVSVPQNEDFEIWYQFQAGIIYESGRTIGLMLIVNTITEQKLLQKELESAKEEASNAIHELERKMEDRTAELESINKIYVSFVPRQFLNKITIEGVTQAKPGILQEEELTVLFSDIRAYTQLAEHMDVRENFQFLNNYIQLMETPITKNHGFIDKFIGDGILALFDRNQSADDAIKAAIDMHLTMMDHNEKVEKNDSAIIHFGVGINSGEVLIGVLGSASHLDSAVIGEQVNTAARLEQLTRLFNSRILITGATHSKIDASQYCIREIDTIRSVEYLPPMTVYEVFDCDPPEIRDQKLKTNEILLRGIIAYKAKKFKEALIFFEEVLHICPQDLVALEYIKRCYHFQEYPPIGRNWDGIVAGTEYGKIFKLSPRSHRLALGTPTNIHSQSHQRHVAGHAINISGTGMRLELGKRLNISEVIMIEIFFQQPSLDDYLNQVPLKVLSQVIWQKYVEKDGEEIWQVGVKFVMLTSQQKKGLQEVLITLPDWE